MGSMAYGCWVGFVWYGLILVSWRRCRWGSYISIGWLPNGLHGIRLRCGLCLVMRVTETFKSKTLCTIYRALVNGLRTRSANTHGMGTDGFMGLLIENLLQIERWWGSYISIGGFPNALFGMF
ncbi:hypothetical protein AMTRI_Chr08g167200 [Amborella trichopoda]